jgi:hypothetical protein
MAGMQNKRVWMDAVRWSVCVLVLMGMGLSAQMRKVTIPAGKTLQNALKKQVLGQDDGQPFHVVLEISQARGSDSQYTATIEETWLAKDRWVRTVRAQGIEQTVIANESGLHYVTAGDYFPLWLHAFVMGMFSPVPDITQWTPGSEMIEYMVLPNGAKSTPSIHHEFMLGAETRQINFANLSFNSDGLLEMVQGPEFAVSFGDYVKFGKLRVPHSLSVNIGRVSLGGKVSALETPGPDARVPEVPTNATARDPLSFVEISTQALEKLAGDNVSPKWPATIPWSGQFTIWVAIDKTGKVRQAESRNCDLSGFAADMAETFVGRQWKVPVVDGGPVQVEGALVFDYPPKQGTAKGQ